LETAAQVRRECHFPARTDIVQYFAKRLALDKREVLVKRIVALVKTFSDEELYAGYEHASEGKRAPKKRKA
jgi:hypothetical protein